MTAGVSHAVKPAESTKDSVEAAANSLEAREKALDEGKKALAERTRSLARKVEAEANESVKRAEGEIPFLGAAYLAAFLILAGFLYMTKRRHARLESDVAELQARLDEALAAPETETS
jgi:predicted  nucleic acid-binding Zn-ribbon protein